jgi:hypothetical protein
MKSRHPGRVMATALCALAMLAAAPLPLAWQHWRYSREIELPPTEETRLVNLMLQQDVYLHAETSLADIRVTDDVGAEIPYVEHSREAYVQSANYLALILERSFSPGNYTQNVLDLINAPGFHDSVEIDIGQDEFMEWVEVDASDDAQVWRIVQERAPIFRFRREGHGGTQRVHFSENNARYLRLRILDGAKPFPIRSATVARNSGVPPERVALSVKLLPTKPEQPHGTAWSADLGADGVPIREVRFEVGPGEFVREVTIQTSRDNSVWSPIARGEISRFTQNGHEFEELSVPTMQPLRYLRVEVANGNDAPLEGVTPKLYVSRQRIIFEQKPGRSYRLIYGQSEAKPPRYDLARRVSERQMDDAVAAQAGPEEINSDWSDPRPWTESHEFVVWFGVAVAILLLAYTAIHALRSTAPPQSGDRPQV